MTSDHRAQMKTMNDLFKRSETLDAYSIFETLLDEFRELKDHGAIAAIYDTPAGRQFGTAQFEVAYALAEVGRKTEAKVVYERLLEEEPDNWSAMNNLAMIHERANKLRKAVDLITRAHAAAPDDEIVTRNFERISKAVEERAAQDSTDKTAAAAVADENQWVREKLQAFIIAVKNDSDFEGGVIPIPNWKFRVLMRTDETKAKSLKDQWIRKGYIRAVGKADHFVTSYALNPYLQKPLEQAQSRVVPQHWLDGLDRISLPELDDLRFFELRGRLEKVRKQFRAILVRDFESLVVNYILSNYKATIVLSGSLIEGLFLYYCAKKGIKTLRYQARGKSVSKPVEDAQLIDFLSYFDQHKTFLSHIVHLGNVSRYFRNFVHPGKELREDDKPDTSKAQLSFVTACEMIGVVLKS